jgi:hypothetical protein
MLHLKLLPSSVLLKTLLLRLLGPCVVGCNKEQLYALIDAEDEILVLIDAKDEILVYFFKNKKVVMVYRYGCLVPN